MFNEVERRYVQSLQIVKTGASGALWARIPEDAPASTNILMDPGPTAVRDKEGSAASRSWRGSLPLSDRW